MLMMLTESLNRNVIQYINNYVTHQKTLISVQKSNEITNTQLQNTFRKLINYR